MRLFLVAFGAAIMIGGWNYRLFDQTGHVAAGFVPFVAGGTMTLAGIWEIVKQGRTGSAAGPDDAAEVATASGVEVESAAEETVAAIADFDQEIAAELLGEEEQAGWKSVLAVFGVLLMVVILASIIGLLLTLTLMMIVLIWVVEKKKWWQGLLGGAFGFLFGWLVFVQLLGVTLPKGMLGLI